jgi:hypothetical protein
MCRNSSATWWRRQEESGGPAHASGERGEGREGFEGQGAAAGGGGFVGGISLPADGDKGSWNVGEALLPVAESLGEALVAEGLAGEGARLVFRGGARGGCGSFLRMTQYPATCAFLESIQGPE